MTMVLNGCMSMKLRSLLGKPSFPLITWSLKSFLVLSYRVLLWIENLLAKLFSKFYGLYPVKIASVKLVYISPNGERVKGNQMSIVLRNDQQVGFALAFEDKYGNAVSELGSVPAWNVSDEALATLEVSEDGLSATVKPNGPKGSVLLNVVVDADPDEAYEELLGQAEIAILAGKATVVRLSGVITDQVAAPAPAPVEPEDPAEPEVPTEPETPAEPAPETPVETPAEPAPTEPEAPAAGEGEEPAQP